MFLSTKQLKLQRKCVNYIFTYSITYKHIRTQTIFRQLDQLTDIKLVFLCVYLDKSPVCFSYL